MLITERAIVKTGRQMVFSLSPGFKAFNDTEVPAAVANVAPITNMYRVTSDWHGWQGADGVKGAACRQNISLILRQGGPTILTWRST